MNKEEIIERLRALEESLPTELTETENARKIMADSRMYFQKSLDKMESNDLEENTYDELAVERENDRKNLLLNEQKELKMNIIDVEEHHDTLEREMASLSERDSSIASQIERYEQIISGYEIQTNDTITNEEKEYISAKRESRTKELEELRSKKATISEELDKRKRYLERTNKALEQKRAKVVEFNEKIKKIDSNVEEIKRSTKMSAEERQKLELDTEALYRMSRFFSANPKAEINNIISDVEKGSLTEEQVNERVQNVKALLTTGIYSIDGLKAKLSQEQILEKRRETEEAIQALEEKIDDDAYYMKETPVYDEALDTIVAYKEIISNIKDNKSNISSQKDKDNQILLETEKEIKNYDRKIKDEEITISTINTLPMPDSRKAEYIKEIDKKIEDYKESREILKDKVGRIKSKTSDYETQEYIADLRIQKYEAKIQKEKSKLYSLNEDEREKDKQELERLEAILLSTHLSKSVFENDYVEQLDSLIDLTGGKHLESEGKSIPSFVAGFTAEQRKIYDDLIAGLSIEEIKEIEKAAAEKVEEATSEISKEEVSEASKEESFAEKEVPALLSIPDGKKQKVAKFKTLVKEKTDKVKEWFKKNWKKATAAAGAILLAGALMFSCNTSKNNKKVVSDNTMPIKSTTIVLDTPPIADEKDAIPYSYGEIPEITAPEFQPEAPEIPTDFIPSTPETPETPERISTGYILNTELTPGTGNSAPADQREAYLTGESVYNPITDTWVDSQGTKIAQTDSGKFITEQGAEKVIKVDEDTNKLENPDMTPLKDNTANEVKSLEEAAQDGTLTEAEMKERQDYFDTFFGEINQNSSIDLGGR